MPIRENRQAWEDWGRVDPLWAILTRPDARGGRWDLDAFFESGQQTIDRIWQQAQELGVPARHTSGLDFGCGVGRLSRALTSHVDHVVGLDIAETMVTKARDLNRAVPGCEFRVQRADDLAEFPDDSFDVVVTLLVLQHIPSVAAIEAYLAEFVRVLAPQGVFVFQLPTAVPQQPRTLRSRLRSIAVLLRRLGVPARWLYRLGWSPSMPMTAIPAERTFEVLSAAGGKVLASYQTASHGAGIESRDYYVTC
jgi:SAM-dependent methyltransferase